MGITFVERGSGPAVVLLPGLGADHRMFAPQVESLSARFRVVAVDLRGTGSSPVLDVPVADVLSVQARDVVELLDRLGIEAAHLVGVSYGGVLVQRLLIDHPGRCLSGTICDSFADTCPQTLLDHANMLGARATPVLAAPVAVRRAMLAPSVAAMYRRWPRARAALLRAVLTPRGREAALQRSAINRVHHLEDLTRVTTPVLVLVGANSATLRRRALQLHQTIPGAKARMIPDATDPSNLCNQPFFDDAVTAFISDLARR